MFDSTIVGIGGIGSEPFVGMLVFVGLGLMGIVVGVSKLKKLRKFSTADEMSIRDAGVSDGVVSVSGTVSPVDEPLPSPLQDMECVAYNYEIDRGAGEDRNIVDTGKDVVPFTIDDGTGVAAIDPGDDEVEIQRELIHDVALENLADFVTIDRSLQGARTYKEGNITVGDDVTVVGKTTSGSNVDDADIDIGMDDGELVVSSVGVDETVTRLSRQGVLFTSIGAVSVIVGMGIIFV